MFQLDAVGYDALQLSIPVSGLADYSVSCPAASAACSLPDQGTGLLLRKREIIIQKRSEIITSANTLSVGYFCPFFLHDSAICGKKT